jgi:hypothetical protein
MASESFDVMRKRILREYKHSIVRSALRGHRDKGRGLLRVKFTQTGKSGMLHLSYVTLDTLKDRQTSAPMENRGYGAMIIEKISRYDPDSQIPVMVSDGESERFLLGIRRVT